MSRSKLRSNWMRKQYTEPVWPYMHRNTCNSDRNHHRLDEVPKNYPSRYITTHCSAYVEWLQEPTSFGGHNISKGRYRRVNGLARACVKKEIREQIKVELDQYNK